MAGAAEAAEAKTGKILEDAVEDAVHEELIRLQRPREDIVIVIVAWRGEFQSGPLASGSV